MLKLESVYYLGICFERFFLAHKFNANQTKQVNKQKCTKKIDGGRNKWERKEGIHSESAASQQRVYHMFYCLSRYTFVHRFFDIYNYYISCSYLEIINVVS